jgi:3D-(3,5/4)-trihydroxycyclohexane-1,2-dione acylhydrolase (decyclizing)
VTERIQLTVAQAVVKFLARQYSERDGIRQRLIEGCFGIFGHGNIAGLAQALMQDEVEGDQEKLRYFQCRNEQAMVHTAVGFSRMRNRLQTLACTTSVGPGATNLVTGAALATINRIPVLLLPGDVFATRASGTVLQQLESAGGYDVSVNDTLRPVSVFFDRLWRPEQLPSVLLGAMRAMTDPVQTGAVTIALPQDVQAEAYDWPVELFDARIWHIARPRPEMAVLGEAVAAIRASARPLIVAGGGVAYSEATRALRQLAEATGIPVAETQAGKGSLAWDHPQAVGAIGATGTTAANALAAEADLVVGIGTRWSDFTTASQSAFADPGVRFVNINIAALDSHKLSGLSVVADARETLLALTTARGVAGRTGAHQPGERPRSSLGPPGRGGIRPWWRPGGRPPAESGDRRGQRPVGCSRRGGVRSGLDARGPAQDVADQRPQGVPGGVRLLLYGLRDRGGPRG